MKKDTKRGVVTPAKIEKLCAQFWRLGVITSLMLLSSICVPSVWGSVHHDVSAANIDVVQNDTANTTNSVTVTTTLSINDFRIRAGSSRGDYNVQFGDDPADDLALGILISSITQNGRNNNETGADAVGINYMIPAIDFSGIIPTNGLVDATNNSWVIPVFGIGGTASREYNVNVAGALFPFSTWIGANVLIGSGANGGFGAGVTNDLILGTTGLTFGDNLTAVEPAAAGKLVLDLHSFGVDSRTDGVLLVVGGKNEGNFCTSEANPDDGTWNIVVKDKDSNGSGGEEDPFGFVFVPRTNTAVVSGRFLGNGDIEMYSGEFPGFSVSSNSVGTYELRIPGYNPTNGVLIISAEGGNSINQDNNVSYQANAATNGWIITSRDTKTLESPGPTEAVVSFVFIPADNDAPNLVLNPASVSVVEGSTNGFTVALKTQPSADVTVNLASGNSVQGGSISPATLVFTPLDWDVPQPVTVTAVDDLASDGPTKFFITNSVVSGDFNYDSLVVFASATTLDNEPAVAFSSGELIYGIGLSGVTIDGNATLSDDNVTNYNGITMVLTLTANGASDDRLEIRNVGTGAGEVGVSGNNISYGGNNVATFSGGVGTTPLSITFNGSASGPIAQAVLRSATYHNISGTPTANPRSLSVVVTHLDTGSHSASISIRVSLLRSVSFQEGVDSGYGVYTGEADCDIRKGSPFTAFPAGGGSGLFVDYPDIGANGTQILMRFDNIFGNGPGQIPTDASIVSAELYVHVNDNGHGSPLHRMLSSWDANSSTWDTFPFGTGATPDDSVARLAYDSTWNLSSAAPPQVNLGTVNFSVLPDIQAWQSGEANNGWVLPGWPGNLNGTGISPGEDANTNNRPRLRVLWVPAGNASASFQQGVNGYTGAQDTRIRANAPTTEYSTATGVFVDWAVTAGAVQNDEQVLIRFDNIIGYGPGQIFPGSTVHAAILDLNGDIGNAPGDGGTFHSMLVPWDHTNSWDFFNNGITADDSEAVAAPTTVAGNPTLNPNVQAAFLTFDLTSDVAAWVSGARPNYGWVILPWLNGGDGWGFSTSEAATGLQRPRLRVYYTQGPAAIIIQSISRAANSVTLTFSGEIGTTYSVLRSGSVDGTYTEIGSAPVQPNGTATFIDDEPPAGSAFYQIFKANP